MSYPLFRCFRLRVYSPGLFAIVSLFAGCGTSQQFVAIPAGLNRDSATHETFDATAKRYEFIPEIIRVKEGSLVMLRLTAVDGIHGFKLEAFGIDERLEEGKTKVIEFYAPRAGEYDFRCSHLCGLGHFGMGGKLIVY